MLGTSNGFLATCCIDHRARLPRIVLEARSVAGAFTTTSLGKTSGRACARGHSCYSELCVEIDEGGAKQARRGDAFRASSYLRPDANDEMLVAASTVRGRMLAMLLPSMPTDRSFEQASHPQHHTSPNDSRWCHKKAFRPHGSITRSTPTHC